MVKDMRKRGFSIEVPARGADGPNSITSEGQLQRVLTWRRVGGEQNAAGAVGEEKVQQARDRLQEFKQPNSKDS